MSHVSGMKTTVSKALVLASVAALIPKVAAHGYVQSVTGPNGEYGGFDESHYTTKSQGSPVLITNYEIPTYDVWGPAIACGISPQAAQSIAPVSPGDKLWWHWHTHNDQVWTHHEGTHRAFIAPCNGDCTQITNFDNLEWTELSSQYTGQQLWDNNAGTWPVLPLTNNQPWSDTIPPAPNGDYLIRNELTALHFSDQHYYDYVPALDHGGGTEFYVTCMAIRISNSDGSWDMSQAVKFPGAYTTDEPGHYNPTWSDGNTVPLATTNTFARTVWPNGSGNTGNSNQSSGNSNTNNSGNNSGQSSGTPSPTPAAANTVQNPVCNKRRRRSLGRRHHLQARRLTGPAH